MSQHASISRQVVFAKLEAVDRMLDERLGLERKSLCPERERATSLCALARGLCETHAGSVLDQPEVFAEVGWFLLETSEAIALHFPENLFWDLDYPAHFFVQRAMSSELGPIEYLCQARQRMVGLMSLYGIHGNIRFRYAHDFLYGFDWARWVERDPLHRGVQPFDVEFLEYSRQRGHQLLLLVAAEDEKYPPIETSARRNPFSFSRDVLAERALHEALALDGQIPVQAWDPSHTPRSGRTFSDTRDAVAQRMGLSQPE